MSDAARTAHLESVLVRQWDALLDWLRSPEVEGLIDDRPSSLAGWTVAELVSHFGLAMGTASLAFVAEEGTPPHTLSAYLPAYEEAREGIAESTRTLAQELGDARLEGVDQAARAAFAHLATLREADVIMGRRGPLVPEDFVVTRLIELVVHGDDLERSLPGAGPVPIDPEALAIVSDAFVRVAEDRTGHRVRVADERAWVALAAGREPVTPEAVAAAVAEPAPEVEAALPLM